MRLPRRSSSLRRSRKRRIRLLRLCVLRVALLLLLELLLQGGGHLSLLHVGLSRLLRLSRLGWSHLLRELRVHRCLLLRGLLMLLRLLRLVGLLLRRPSLLLLRLLVRTDERLELSELLRADFAFTSSLKKRCQTLRVVLHKSLESLQVAGLGRLLLWLLLRLRRRLTLLLLLLRKCLGTHGLDLLLLDERSFILRGLRCRLRTSWRHLVVRKLLTRRRCILLARLLPLLSLAVHCCGSI